jgi:predicted MFS family arabinose efflux permease
MAGDSPEMVGCDGLPGGAGTLSRVQIRLLALASAVVTANAYYIHPIIARVAQDFGVGAAMIGAVPALNQLALALGIFFLLPLGDRISNRRLVSVFVTAQFLSICVMAIAREYWVFVAGSTLLGFFTIAPYLLPAYVSKRVEVSRLGRVTAVLTTGIIAGILVARVGAGIFGEYLGWRAVYYLAAALMLAVSFMLPLVMDEREGASRGQAQESYFSLIFSLPAVIRNHPEILLSGAIQGVSFGIFLSVWLGLGLHLTSPEMGYGVDIVGYLAGFTLLNLIVTPRLGAWADRVGARRARVIVASVQLSGTLLLHVFGHSLWLLMIPIVLMNLAGPMIDITGRMTFLGQESSVRTRLMTVYIMMMFIGGGIASWAGTAAYDLAGWNGNAGLALALSLVALSLALLALRHPPAGTTGVGLAAE